MTQAILNVTGTVLRGLINANVFVIATGTKAISVAAASTPMISNNAINVPSGTAPVIAAAGFVANNSYSAAAGVTAAIPAGTTCFQKCLCNGFRLCQKSLEPRPNVFLKNW